MAQPMKTRHALDILTRMAQALAAVHTAGVIHRDLKPDNVILRAGVSPVIVDFGIALIGGRDAAGPAGTRDYMAPEQARGRAVDARADIYSLGVIAYQMLTGNLPQAASSAAVAVIGPMLWRRRVRNILIAGGIDRALGDLVVRMLAPSRRHRPSSATAIAAQFSVAANEAGAGTTTIPATRVPSG
jgi:serine/threonine protein kinase